MALHDPGASPDALGGRTVLLAMSGGVDSSVAAVLLLERGARVLGLTMKNFCYSRLETGARSCCSAGHLMDARRVCERLGIEHHLLDTSAPFERDVMERFAAEYEAGRTPNPCVDCNQFVRFPQLAARARELDADCIATGHYARLGRQAGGQCFVRRAVSAAKDQSYFLHGVPPSCLETCVFPLGDLAKDEVRAAGRRAGLGVADKPESQEICFLPDGDRAAWLAERQAAAPGPIVALDGRRLGTHGGIAGFTVGQRHGLGLGGGRTLYVHHIEAETRTVVVSDAAALWSGGLEADRFSLRVDPSRDDLEVQVRYRHRPVRLSKLEVEGARARLQFAAPQRAVAPGQAAVVYAGDAVVGGGRILAALP